MSSDPTPAIQISSAWIGLTGAVAGAALTSIGALLGAVVTNRRNRRRDAQDRESEWRSHAVELAKVENERLIEARKNNPNIKLEPTIFNFLALYRDLHLLNDMTVEELYAKIVANNLIEPKEEPTAVRAVAACAGPNDDHPKVFLAVDGSATCPYCSKKFVASPQA